MRLATIDLIAREINEKNIEGVIAELGVYKGDLTKFLLKAFEGRKFVLLDTFEGFDEQNLHVEQKKDNQMAVEGYFGDVNIQEIEQLITGQQVDIVKGYFPDSVEHYADQKYAFVSLDVDLYKPILAGLLYFYPKLAKGGYLLVHDYNHEGFSGVKQAVREFEGSFNVSGIPLPDFYGSYIFVK